MTKKLERKLKTHYIVIEDMTKIVVETEIQRNSTVGTKIYTGVQIKRRNVVLKREQKRKLKETHGIEVGTINELK